MFLKDIKLHFMYSSNNLWFCNWGISSDQVGGLVVVDIDEGSLSINPEIADDSRSVRSGDSDSIEDLLDIPEIPEEAAKLFLNVCRKARFQFDLVDTKR